MPPAISAKAIDAMSPRCSENNGPELETAGLAPFHAVQPPPPRHQAIDTRASAENGSAIVFNTFFFLTMPP